MATKSPLVLHLQEQLQILTVLQAELSSLAPNAKVYEFRTAADAGALFRAPSKDGKLKEVQAKRKEVEKELKEALEKEI